MLHLIAKAISLGQEKEAERLVDRNWDRIVDFIREARKYTYIPNNTIICSDTGKIPKIITKNKLEDKTFTVYFKWMNEDYGIGGSFGGKDINVFIYPGIDHFKVITILVHEITHAAQFIAKNYTDIVLKEMFWILLSKIPLM